MSILATNVTVTESALSAKVEVWKGRDASREPPLCYHHPPVLVSPADATVSWSQLRFADVRFFAMLNEPAEWENQSITAALQRVLNTLNIQPPPHG